MCSRMLSSTGIYKSVEKLLWQFYTYNVLCNEIWYTQVSQTEHIPDILYDLRYKLPSVATIGEPVWKCNIQVIKSDFFF